MAVWTSSPSLAEPSFLQSPLSSGLSARHHSLSPLPQTHRNFLPNALRFLGGGGLLFWGCFNVAAPRSSAPPCLPVGGQRGDQSESGGCLLCFCSRSNGSRGAPPPWPDPRQLQTAQPSTVCSSPLLNAKNRAVQSWSESPSGL